MIQIEFRYLLKSNKGQWIDLPMTVEEYFDMKLEKDEVIEVDSCPLYMELVDYTDHDSEDVSVIFTRISETDNGDYLQFTQTFWNQHKNFIIETERYINRILDKEYIIESLVNTTNEDKVYEIIRLSYFDNVLRPTMHSIMTEDDYDLASIDLT